MMGIRQLGPPLLAVALLALSACGRVAGTAAGSPRAGGKRAGPAAAVKPARAPHATRPAPVTPRAMYWASPATGYLIAQSTLYRTANGGAAWDPLFPSGSAHAPGKIDAIAGVGAAHVWIATAASVLEVSSTGRVSHLAPLPAGGSVDQLAAPSPSPPPGRVYALMAGSVYALDITTEHWADVSTAIGPVQSMAWLSARVGYAAAGSRVWRTETGGQTWDEVFTAPMQGSHWAAHLAENSADSVWLLVSGGVDSASQMGFVLWHGTAAGTKWTAVTDEAYLAPTAYPSVHPQLASPIMDPGPLAAVGAHTVYLAGWQANRDSHWVVLTNAGGSWHVSSFLIAPSAPQFFVSRAGGSFVSPALSFAASSLGHLLGQSASGQGALMKTADGGSVWRSATAQLPR